MLFFPFRSCKFKGHFWIHKTSKCMIILLRYNCFFARYLDLHCDLWCVVISGFTWKEKHTRLYLHPDVLLQRRHFKRVLISLGGCRTDFLDRHHHCAAKMYLRWWEKQKLLVCSRLGQLSEGKRTMAFVSFDGRGTPSGSRKGGFSSCAIASDDCNMILERNVEFELQSLRKSLILSSFICWHKNLQSS